MFSRKEKNSISSSSDPRAVGSSQGPEETRELEVVWHSEPTKNPAPIRVQLLMLLGIGTAAALSVAGGFLAFFSALRTPRRSGPEQRPDDQNKEA